MPSNQESWIRVGDTGPSLPITCIDAVNGNPVNLSTATSVTIVGVPSKPGQPVIERVVTGGSNGVVLLVWQTGDTAFEQDIEIVVKVVWPDGSKQTFPVNAVLTVHVVFNLP